MRGVSMYVCMHVFMCHSMYMEVRGKSSSLLPPCVFQVSNSGYQTWQQVPLPPKHLTGPVRVLNIKTVRPPLGFGGSSTVFKL